MSCSRGFIRVSLIFGLLLCLLLRHNVVQNSSGNQHQTYFPESCRYTDEQIDLFLNETYLSRTVNTFQGGGGETWGLLGSEPSVAKFILEAKKREIYISDVDNASQSGLTAEVFCASGSLASRYISEWSLPNIKCGLLRKVIKEKAGPRHLSVKHSKFSVLDERKYKLRITLKDIKGDALHEPFFPVHVIFASPRAIIAGCAEARVMEKWKFLRV